MATPIDAHKENTVVSSTKENGASESTSMEALAHNPGTGPSPMHPQAYAGRLGRKLLTEQKGDKRSNESSSTLGASVPGKPQSEKGSLLPKFGDWDVNDPASGVGFTEIFEKAADEKKTGRAGGIQPKHAESLLPTNFGGSSQSSSQDSSCLNWCCCCFYPRRCT